MTTLILRIRLWLAQVEYDDRVRRYIKYQGEADWQAVRAAEARLYECYAAMYQRNKKAPLG